MGFIKLGSGHVIHASQLPVLNPPGSVEALIFNPDTQKWDVLIEKMVPLDPDISDMINENFWDLM